MRSALDIEASAGFARGTYTKLMSGKVKLRVHHLESLSKALCISLTSLFWDAYGSEDGGTRLADLFSRLLSPEIERFLRPNGSFPTPAALTKRFRQLHVEE